MLEIWQSSNKNNFSQLFCNTVNVIHVVVPYNHDKNKVYVHSWSTSSYRFSLFIFWKLQHKQKTLGGRFPNRTELYMVFHVPWVQACLLLPTAASSKTVHQHTKTARWLSF